MTTERHYWTTVFLTSPSRLLLAPRSLRDSYAVMVLGLSFLFLATPGRAQVGNSGSIEGVVKDQSGSAVSNASVEVMNPVSGFHRETTTDSDGAFRFTNVPFNPYHMVAGAPGFAKYTQDVDVRSTVPISTQITLKIAAAEANVTVEVKGGDLIENDSTFHTDVDQGIIDRLPLESQSSSVSSLVTLVTPGVAADSNGLFHGLGDHASNSNDLTNSRTSDLRSSEVLTLAVELTHGHAHYGRHDPSLNRTSMRLGHDIAVRFPGLYLVHHNIPGMKVDWHDWADQHLLFIPLQGEITILLQSGSLVGGPGKMLYLPPKTSLNFQASKTLGERLVCLIEDTRWRAMTSFQSGPAMSPAQQLCKEQLFYLLLNPKTKSAESVVSAFIQVLAESVESTQRPSLLELTHLEAKVRDERVRKALTILLRDHRTRVRMAAVAQEAGLSVRNLGRLFLDQVGLSPRQVLAQYRIAAAQDLLLTGSTVAQAAFATGYESLAQFIKIFRRLTGQLPSQVVHLGRKQ